MNGTSIPIIDLGGYSVHAVDPFHEGGRDVSQEEVDEGVFVGDFAEGDMVLELGDIISEWEVLGDRGGGEPSNSFVLDINMDK